jgi:hypothetical protein
MCAYILVVEDPIARTIFGIVSKEHRIIEREAYLDHAIIVASGQKPRHKMFYAVYRGPLGRSPYENGKLRRFDIDLAHPCAPRRISMFSVVVSMILRTSGYLVQSYMNSKDAYFKAFDFPTAYNREPSSLIVKARHDRFDG